MTNFLTNKWGIDNLSDQQFFMAQTVDIEFGQNEYQFKQQTDQLNPTYFKQVVNEMRWLFEFLFKDNEQLNMVITITGEDEPLDTYIDWQAFGNCQMPCHVSEYTRIDGAYGEANESYAKEFVVETTTTTIRESLIFKAIANQDFPTQSPQMITANQRDKFWTNLYFVNDRVIFNPYDDRGAAIKFYNEADYQVFIANCQTKALIIN